MTEEAPIQLLLHCPVCHRQHIDEVDEATNPGWQNPPHTSHKCLHCGTIWRPADVPTEGVRSIATHGSSDTWPALSSPPAPVGGGDGWTDWTGAEWMPLPENTAVEVELSCGARVAGPVGLFRWTARGTDADIVAYRKAPALSAPPAPVGGDREYYTDLIHRAESILTGDEARDDEVLIAVLDALRDHRKKADALAALSSPPLQGGQGFSSVAGASPSLANEPATDREVVE